MRAAIFVLGALCALAGCASPPSREGFNDDIDYARMAAIDRQARFAGVTVIWLNSPRKARQVTATTPAPAPAAPTGSI